jgi:hypothetical protein
MRPELQLFLHVLGAIALFGAILLLCVLGLAGRRAAGPLPAAALATSLAVAVPGWVLMLVFGSWTKSKEGLPGTVDWLRLPNAIALVGIAVLVATSGIAYSWKRRPDGGWQPSVLALVSGGYALALGAAWWMMTAKVPA